MGPVRVVNQVDLPRLMGRWFVISSVPTIFDREAHNPIENFIWNDKEKHIDIHYTYNHGSFEGIVREMPQKAYVMESGSNAEWKVQPIWPLRLNYVVAELCPEYTYAVLAMKDRTHVWILSRSREMSDECYQGIIARLAADGFPIAKLRRFPHRKDFSKVKVEPLKLISAQTFID